MRKPTKDEIEQFANRVWPIYVILDWHWGLGENSQIPSKLEIIDSVESLINHIDPPEITRTETGGLWAQYDPEFNAVNFGFVITHY